VSLTVRDGPIHFQIIVRTGAVVRDNIRLVTKTKELYLEDLPNTKKQPN
jgi:hypothetical protein